MRFCAIVMLSMLAACGTKNFKVTRTGAAVATAKPANCEFVVATTKVDHPYEEVAILDCQDYAPRDAADFKELVSKDVCELGGDAVIAEVNGTGHYIRGTVLHFTEAK